MELCPGTGLFSVILCFVVVPVWFRSALRFLAGLSEAQAFLSRQPACLIAEEDIFSRVSFMQPSAGSVCVLL